jgi:hypothetical protein
MGRASFLRRSTLNVDPHKKVFLLKYDHQAASIHDLLPMFPRPALLGKGKGGGGAALLNTKRQGVMSVWGQRVQRLTTIVKDQPFDSTSKD